MRSDDPPPDAIVKRHHRVTCRYDLYRTGIVHTDRTGRIGNGGWVAYDYRCNGPRWNDCPARVLVYEATVHRIATAAATPQESTA